MPFNLKRLLVGQPLPTEGAHHQRLPETVALAVFASDALSSTIYAMQKIMSAPGYKFIRVALIGCQ